MQKQNKNMLQDPIAELNEVLQNVDARVSREDLSYDTTQLPRSSIEDNSRPERELSGVELERAKEEFLSSLSRSPIPDLTPRNPYWQFVLGSESENVSPSLYDLLSRGYSYVQPEDCKENVVKLLVKKEGEHSGFLRRKEMVYLKIPKALYEAALEELHHNKPAEQQANTYAAYMNNIDGGSTRGKRAGAKFSMGKYENISFRDENTNELLGFIPGYSEQNGLGIPKAFGRPANWDNIIKKTQGE